MNVDLYVGGAEHSTLHLLYARFWHKVLYDIGVVSTKEPFQKLVHQGMILGEMEYILFRNTKGQPVSAELVDSDHTIKGLDEKVSFEKLSEDDVEKRGDVFVWRENPSIQVEAKSYKMSKSRGNVVNPDEVIAQYGADSLRLYEMFMGPLEQMKPWSTKGVEGVYRFLNRIWRLYVDEDGNLSPIIRDVIPNKEQLFHLHQTIKKVTDDIENLRFNTAIAQMSKQIADTFVLLISPFAPHIAEELWEKLGHNSTLAYQPWPEYDEKYLIKEETEVVIQINGKLRYKLTLPAGLDRETTQKKAMEVERIQKMIEGKHIVKVIVVPDKLVNIVVR